MFTYEIIGVSPDWQYSELQATPPSADTTYLAHPEYYLKVLIATVETLHDKRPRDQERMIQAIYDFWIDHIESVHYWRDRLAQAGEGNVLISRFRPVADRRDQLESLLRM